MNLPWLTAYCSIKAALSAGRARSKIMKTYLRLEIFNDNLRSIGTLYTNILNEGMPGLGNKIIGNIPPSCWVAEITGFDAKYKYDRHFLKYKKDYSHANSKGSRGIYGEYILESNHIYEVKEQISWSRTKRYFCMATEDGEIKELTEQEVINWLNNTLGLMSSQQQGNE
jgi:hypothetical protein